MAEDIKQMPSREILEYFDATECRETRDDLKLAVAHWEGPRIAIDCGCGAGSDIAFLRTHGFTVHAFDIEPEAIARCQRRFGEDAGVNLSQDSFSSFDYPPASLIVADASLFFCPKGGFDAVWQKICDALLPDGIFVGSFLGQKDTMARPGNNQAALWPNVLVTSEPAVRLWLSGFEVISFREHRQSGIAPDGAHHHWHIYSVVARKGLNNSIQPTTNTLPD